MNRYILQAIFLNIICGALVILNKYIASNIGQEIANLVFGIKFSVISLIMIYIGYGKTFKGVSKGEACKQFLNLKLLFILFAIGFMRIFLYSILINLASPLVEGSFISASSQTICLLIILLNLLVYKEVPKKQEIPIIHIYSVGVCLLFLGNGLSSAMPLGFVLTFIAILLEAIASLLMKYVACKYKFDFILIIGSSNIMNGILLSIIYFDMTKVLTLSMISMVIIIMVCVLSFVTQIMWSNCANKLELYELSFISIVATVVATLFDYILYTNLPSVSTLIAYTLMVYAVVGLGRLKSDKGR